MTATSAPAFTLSAPSLDKPVAASNVENAYYGYGWRGRGWGWRRPWGYGYGYGWRYRPWGYGYGYGWRYRPWGYGYGSASPVNVTVGDTAGDRMSYAWSGLVEALESGAGRALVCATCRDVD